jgi:AcrR family transcriptional regulator
MSPKKVDKDQKKQTILLAAMKVIAQKGVKNTKMADVAAMADIGKGTIYEYFRSRDEIFIEACNFVILSMESRLRRELSIRKAPEQKLRDMTRIIFSGLEQFSPEMAALFIDIWSEGIRHKTGASSGLIDLEHLYDEMRSEFKLVIDDGIKTGQFRRVDSYLAASAVLAVIDGLILQWILSPEAIDLKTADDKIMDLYLNGLKNKEVQGG